MASARRFAVALATLSFSGSALLAQAGGNAQQPASPPSVQVPASAPQAQSPSTQTQATNTAPAVELKPVKAELVKSLDSKSAKPGDPVVAKTREAVTTANGTAIPKGSKLVGTVMLVKPHSNQQQNSELAVKFDHAELKGGQAVPIHSVIQSLSPPAEEMASPADAMAGTPMASTPTGGASAGGGAASTGSRSSMPSTGSAPGGAAPGTAAQTSAGGQGSAGGPVPGQVVAGSGPNAIRTTSIPNVYLASNANGPVSGTMFSAKSNVRLDGGTQMVLDIAAGNSQ